MFESDKLLELASTIKADSIVLSDYPGEPASKTIGAAQHYAPIYKEAGFRTFFCPQSRVGDIEDMLYGFRFALMNPDLIDFIGVSILACPNALGIEQVAYDKQGQVDEAYRMQRFLARWRVMQLLEERNLLPDSTQAFHMLGMNDGVREIALLEPWHEYIFSWDSSSAYQHAMHGIRFDNSPTGLRNGKLDKHVDFATKEPMTATQLQDFLYNVSIINELVQES